MTSAKLKRSGIRFAVSHQLFKASFLTSCLTLSRPKSVSWVIHGGRRAGSFLSSTLHVVCSTRSVILERCFVFCASYSLRIKSCALPPPPSHFPCPTRGLESDVLFRLLPISVIVTGNRVPTKQIKNFYFQRGHYNKTQFFNCVRRCCKWHVAFRTFSGKKAPLRIRSHYKVL